MFSSANFHYPIRSQDNSGNGSDAENGGADAEKGEIRGVGSADGDSPPAPKRAKLYE